MQKQILRQLKSNGLGSQGVRGGPASMLISSMPNVPMPAGASMGPRMSMESKMASRSTRNFSQHIRPQNGASRSPSPQSRRMSVMPHMQSSGEIVDSVLREILSAKQPSEVEKSKYEFTTKTHRDMNEDVRLDHFKFAKEDGTERKPMLVLHGLLANKFSLRRFASNEKLLEKRDCYLPDMRNGIFSDSHDEWTYDLYAEDVLRFADWHGLEKFDVLGHSLGGRVAMTLACNYPDRTDGVICLDSRPGNSVCEKDMYDLMRWMGQLEDIRNLRGLTKEDATKMIEEKFADSTNQSTAILIKQINQDKEQLEWLYNAKAFFNKEDDVSYFNTDQTSELKTIYHIAGEDSPDQVPNEEYFQVFKNQQQENLILMKGTGHFPFLDKPEETTNYVMKFLDDIDQRINF